MIYLDNAATSWPKPPEVLETLGTFLNDFGANPGRSGYRMASQTAARIDAVRRDIASLINAEGPERIVFTHNATEALNLAVLGLGGPTSTIVSTSMEHNSVRRPLRVLETMGSAIRRVEAEPTGVVSIDAMAKAIPGAQLIAMTHASNVNGAVQPIAEVAELARKAGALLIVDGAQSLGAMPLDVQALGIDLLAFPGHKGLQGPPGTGGLYVGPRVDLDQLRPLTTGGTGIRSEDDEQVRMLPGGYESGTVNTVGIGALGAGVQVVMGRGVSAIQAHHDELRDRLVTGLQGIRDITVYAPDQAQAAAVVSFTVAGMSPAEAGAILEGSFQIACRTGLHCAPDACRTIGAGTEGTVRFSPGWTTTIEEIDTAIEAVREIASVAVA